MNITYFRKSKQTIDKIQAALVKNAKKVGLDISSITTLTNPVGRTLVLSKKEWIEGVLLIDKQLLALLPSYIVIIEDGKSTSIGASHGALLGSASHDLRVQSLAKEIQETLQSLIDLSSGSGKREITDVIVYSTTTCPYCKMEEDWLTQHNIQYTKTLVDANPEKAQELVKKTGQMGVPVTEIQYNDGDSEFVIGFDKPRLANTFSTT